MTEKIRVAMIMGKWVGGGVEAVVMNYYKHIDTNILQFDFIFDSDSRDVPIDYLKSRGSKVYFIPPYNKPIYYHKSLKKILKDGQYKIVHSHINTLSVFSLFAAKCAKVPIRIAHSHSTTNSKEKGKNLLKQLLRPFSKTFATEYMTCSELAGRWLFGDKLYNSGNVYLLNNAIDTNVFSYNINLRDEMRKTFNIAQSTLVIGHIGRFVAQKNHDFLIDIFYEIYRNNSDSMLVLAGEGPLLQQIKDKVKSLGISSAVQFLGQRSDAPSLYQMFDVFLLPSLYEGLPVVGVESQAAGLLCILSDDMTYETKVLKTTKFLSLDQTAKEWAKDILSSYTKFERKDTSREVESHGFEITTEVKKLEMKYLELWKRV
ncbi:glycosyltransferase family 1 protein [Streptococcus suis]|uniref:glycosyltransferase family 1 protein n=1 Tax=Streptococcus parasuis TaxID=1501662 RepID=UPI0015559E12|nr:glycosyltransferase family 1 protein [Streptococcus suis]WNF87128.1 glycosyltransferase family 1 protein [Streptococcus parasuis]